jgi:hypothetical protein
MSKYKELVYMVLDELKISSDDSFFTEDHVIFLLDKYRSVVLRKAYEDVATPVPDSNKQTICLSLEKSPALSGDPCDGGYYLKSTEKVPSMIEGIAAPTVYPVDYYQNILITYISKERMRFVGYNRFLKNIIYVSKGGDNYLYFKSSNPLHMYLKKIKLSGVFDDAKEAAKLSCDDSDTVCDILDAEFPLESSLVPDVIRLVLQELSPSVYKPEDKMNNADDDLSDIGLKAPQNES